MCVGDFYHGKEVSQNQLCSQGAKEKKKDRCSQVKSIIVFTPKCLSQLSAQWAEVTRHQRSS